MDAISVSQSPFAVLTFIAAPALLTNASSVLALSTTNRMLRTRDRMQELFAKAESPNLSEEQTALLIDQVNRVEIQGGLLLRALRDVYLALGAFAAATLVTLLGAALVNYQDAVWFWALAGLGLLLGFLGVTGLVLGSGALFRATRLSLLNIADEAALIRKQQLQRKSAQAAARQTDKV
ncbi:MAG: DUF2721 domain-containing protein [Planctomycetes bacterium]|nr:DUF2721 domain-containing protein [Planctomycetota bacterium]